MSSWPADVPAQATSFRELQASLLSDRLVLGVAKDHGKDWWTLSPESRGRLLAQPFLYFPILLGLGVIVAAVVTLHFTWLIALPFGFVAFMWSTPLNPNRLLALLLAFVLYAIGWFAGWSSLIVSGLVVGAIYLEMQAYYKLGVKAFRRFLISDAEGFVKYWNMGLVWLLDPVTGESYTHEKAITDALEELGTGGEPNA